MTTLYSKTETCLQKLEQLIADEASDAETLVRTLEDMNSCFAEFLNNNPAEDEAIALQARVQILLERTQNQRSDIAAKLKRMVQNNQAHKAYGAKK